MTYYTKDSEHKTDWLVQVALHVALAVAWVSAVAVNAA